MLKTVSKVIFAVIACAAVSGLPSCKKETPPAPQIPVLKPRAYLPAFPGSWWKYELEDGDTLSWTTSPSYVSHSYTQSDFNASPTTGVPYLNGEPLYEYDRIVTPQGSLYSERWPMLSENINEHFDREHYAASVPDSLREHIAVLGKIPNLTLYGNTYDTVLVQRGFSWSLNDQQTLTPVYTSEYFARNVGLVLKVKVDTACNDTFYRQVLTSYHIEQ